MELIFLALFGGFIVLGVSTAVLIILWGLEKYNIEQYDWKDD